MFELFKTCSLSSPSSASTFNLLLFLLSLSLSLSLSLFVARVERLRFVFYLFAGLCHCRSVLLCRCFLGGGRKFKKLRGGSNANSFKKPFRAAVSGAQASEIKTQCLL